jgi:hypothetical protein
MHTILTINSILQYTFAVTLVVLLVAWVFEFKIFSR